MFASTVSYLEAGVPDAPPLVCLHGIGGDARSFGPQLEGLANECRVVAWSMPGFGATPCPGPMTFALLADALEALLDQLGLDAAHLLGHSIGGMVAQELAARRPERVRSLVLSATSPAFGRRDGDFQERFVAARLGPLDEGATMAELAAGIVEELVGEDPDPAGLDLARACMAAVPEATYRAAIRCLTTFDRRTDLGRIAVPTLLIAGAEDSNAPAPMMEKMATFIPGAEYRCIEGAGHLANLERPAQFNELVRRFLAAG